MKRRQNEEEGGGGSFQSDACQALTKVLVFWGGCDMDWGRDELRGTQLSSRDYYKEVCIVKLYLIFQIILRVCSQSALIFPRV